jgi:hypothetical protein
MVENLSVSGLAFNRNGNEDLFIFPDYVVRTPQGMGLRRSGALSAPDAVGLATSAEELTYDPSEADLDIAPSETLCVVGPSYWQSYCRLSEEKNLDGPEGWIEFRDGFRIRVGRPWELVSLRTRIADEARRCLDSTLRAEKASRWPTECDDWLRLFLADPKQPLIDRLHARALCKLLTDSLGFERVLKFDARRLHITETEFRDRIDRWIHLLREHESGVFPAEGTGSLLDSDRTNFPEDYWDIALRALTESGRDTP